jgi:VIT1/CCC1 family predicted Fe2+/Mn2+ transporter
LKAIHFKRYICIGVVDGIIIPLVVAAVLSQRQMTPATIVGVCLAVAIAGALTMAAGSFIEGRKYERPQFTWTSSLIIGLGYLLGGIIVSIPFFFDQSAAASFKYSALAASAALIIAGFVEGRLQGHSGWEGSLRVWLMAAIATSLAYMVAGIV